MHIYVFSAILQRKTNFEASYVLPWTDDLPVCLSSIAGFALGGWALSEERQISFLQELSPIVSGGKIENGGIVFLKVYLVTLSCFSCFTMHDSCCLILYL